MTTPTPPAITITSRLQSDREPAPSITVTGHGRVRLPPDRIVFTISISSLAPSVDASLHELERQRDAVAAALESAAVPADRIRASGANLHPEHDYEKQVWRFKGIRGTETITVRIPMESGRATAVLRSLGEHLQWARVAVSYLARDTAEARKQALTAAIADSRSQAETLAQAAACRLGTARTIAPENEGRGMGLLSASCAEERPQPGFEVAPMEIVVETGVEVTWDLLPGG